MSVCSTHSSASLDKWFSGVVAWRLKSANGVDISITELKYIGASNMTGHLD
jgi:hypothetical protein